MIIPIRCFTCGNVLADKWIPYITSVQEEKNKSNGKVSDNLDLSYIDVKSPDIQKSIEAQIIDEMKLHKYCCRRMMLTNVHLISYI